MGSVQQIPYATAFADQTEMQQDDIPYDFSCEVTRVTDDIVANELKWDCEKNFSRKTNG